MKKLFTICLLLATSFTVTAQVNFEDEHLAILEKIAFTTSYKTIKSFMKNNNYSFQEEIVDDEVLSSENDDFIEAVNLTFKGIIGNTISVCYDKKNKIFMVVENQIAGLNTVFSEIELKEKAFKIKEEDEAAKYWFKSSYKYQIITDKRDEKIHFLMIISPLHSEFVK
jgi:hypothetical protein